MIDLDLPPEPSRRSENLAVAAMVLFILSTTLGLFWAISTTPLPPKVPVEVHAPVHAS